MLKFESCSGLFAVACALLSMAAGAPAAAQEPAAEFTVIGHAEGPYERSLSAAVFYGDLDLTRASARVLLRQRVRKTASELCRQLGGGPENATGLAFVCEDEAVQSAADFQRVAIARATSKTFAATSLKVSPAK